MRSVRFVRYARWFGRTGLPRTLYRGQWKEHRRLKEMEAERIENQRPVVNLVSPVPQTTEMARSEIKREREMAKSKTFVPPGRRKKFTRSIPKDYF